MGVCKHWGPWVKGVRDGCLCLSHGLRGCRNGCMRLGPWMKGFRGWVCVSIGGHG